MNCEHNYLLLAIYKLLLLQRYIYRITGYFEFVMFLEKEIYLLKKKISKKLNLVKIECDWE